MGIEDKKITVMTFGDNPKMSTGYGCVWDNLLRRWAKMKPKWDFMHVGWQNTDRPHKRAEGYYMLPRGRDNHGFDMVLPNLMKYKPEILITLCDVGKQSGFIAGIKEAKQRGWKGKWLAYTPIDCHQWAVHWTEIFATPDINIAMAKFGEIMMKNNDVPNVKYIPHGVDTKAYFPSADRGERRKAFGINEKFVVGFVGRNQTRKMIPHMMRGFANFAKGKDDVTLLMHTDAHPPGGEGRGSVIDALVWKFEKESGGDLFASKKIMMTQGDMDILTRQAIQPDNMNDVYNLFDLFLYSTGGEGFGLPAIESQASGLPILMSNNTTGPELVEESGELIDTLKDNHGRPIGYIGTNGVENLIPDDVHITQLLEKYYTDWKGDRETLKEMSEKSRKFALTYDWDIVAKLWLDLFEENI